MPQRKTVLLRDLSTALAGCVSLFVASGFAPSLFSDDHNHHRGSEALVNENASRMIEEGKHTFRYDTFGDEAFWGDRLKLQQAIAGAAQGGIGPGVSPITALAVGLKVDVDALPEPLRVQLAQGRAISTPPPLHWL
jgi:hypothetical protein